MKRKPLPAQGPVDVNVRPCTCHPDDRPPIPCARKYALSECMDEMPHKAGQKQMLELAKGYRATDTFARLVRNATLDDAVDACRDVAESYRGTGWGDAAEKICDNIADAIRAMKEEA